MKRTLLLALTIISCSTGFCQSRKDFFNFIGTFNWSISEVSFKAKYAARIVPETDSLYIKLELEPSTYLINDMKVGDYDCYTLVTYDAEDTPFVLSTLTNEALEASMPSVLAMKLDKLVEQKMREPDMKLDDIPLSTLGFDAAEDVTGNVRAWMTDILSFSTFRTITEDGLFYLLIASKGEPREPNFRKGRWGDSMAECKSKEGKKDEYGMENIYAFDTWVAGIQAIAAYRFTDDRLTSGKYVFTNENAENCVRDYDNLVSYLTEKYGEPEKINKEYLARDYEKSYYSDGQLIRDGKLEMSTYWFTQFSVIAIILNGEKGSISMGLEYYSTKLNQVRKDSILNDL